MTCKQIYDSAAALALSQTDNPSEVYLAALPTIINMFVRQHNDLVKIYCTEKKMNDWGGATVEVKSADDIFPLPDRFAPAAFFFVAATLCASYNTKCAQYFNELYINSLKSIRMEIPPSSDRIRNVYK